MRLVGTVTAVLGLFFAAVSANATLKTTAPAEVCAALNSVGLPTSGWKPVYDTFQCLSTYKPIGTAFPLPNNLAFYAKGERATVRKVELMLNVNDPTKAAAALSELLKAAEVLCPKVTGEPLPPAARAAIKGGRKASAKAGPSSVEVAREEMVNGGYSVQLLIK